MRIDAHQHFWLFDPLKDAWITEEMKDLKRNFLPNDISLIMKTNQIDGVIAVQADQSLRENDFLLELAQAYALIKGIVGWVDLRSKDLEEQLDHYAQFPKIKGFRHLVEAETDPDFLMNAEFLQGISALSKRNFTYDLLIKPIHYQSTLACVKANPSQRFMLDHMAKPPIKTQEFDDWAVFIAALSTFPNVYCKISGLGTEADWKQWKLEHFTSYIAHAIHSFGPERIVFGSDWPVCLLAGTYEENLSIVESHLMDFSAEEKKGFWGLNAVAFYGLK